MSSSNESNSNYKLKNEEVELDLSSMDQNLLAPFDYLRKNPGKSFRNMLMASFQEWFKVEDKELKVIEEVIEMLHTSSLLIDDVQDGSTLRRGKPVAHLIYGMPTTINTANLVYFQALNKLVDLNNHELIKAYTDELVQLHKGQGAELYYRDHSVLPTLNEYFWVVENKTGGLLRLGIKLMQLLSKNEDKVDAINLVNKLGRAYQVRDDYLNLSTDEYHNAKGFCDDLTEGKYSHPIIHALTPNLTLLSSHEQVELSNILQQKTENVELKKYAVQLIDKAGGLNASMETLSKLIIEVKDEIKKLGGNKGLESLVSKLGEKN